MLNPNPSVSCLSERIMWDIFICHASEDKEEIARPLADALKSAGLAVWYDTFNLKLGDSLRESIDLGLAQSRFGVVILSPNFFSKVWPQRELNGLITREITAGKIILPILHKVTPKDVEQFSPMLSDKLGALTDDGLDKVVSAILRVARPEITCQPLEFRSGKAEHNSRLDAEEKRDQETPYAKRLLKRTRLVSSTDKTNKKFTISHRIACLAFSLALASILLIGIFNFHTSTGLDDLRHKLQDKPLDKETIRRALSFYEFDNSDQCSTDEAQKMLEFIGATATLRRNHQTVSGIFGTDGEITIWADTYGDKTMYSVRFGVQDGEYWGSNETLFYTKKRKPDPPSDIRGP